MKYIFFCNECGRRFHSDDRLDACPCGGAVDFDLEYGCAADLPLPRGEGLWQFRPWLPLRSNTSAVTLGESTTACIPVEFGSGRLWLKQDHLMPSGSFKDRGASVMISAVKERNIRDIVIDSSGNAASAVSAYSARAGIQCSVYVPSNVSEAKLIQIRRTGARVNVVKGDRDKTAFEARLAAKESYYASHYMNPFFIAGIMTLAFELYSQFACRFPAVVVLPVGNGSLLLGFWKGICVLKKLGLLTTLPVIVAVQSESFSPVYDAFHGSVKKEKPAATAADGIAIKSPPRLHAIVDLLKHSGGTVVTVSEEEIDHALDWLHGNGFFVEPTGAVGFAGALRWFKRHGWDNDLVTVLTGHGLKAVSKFCR